jgi:hypothetical protein
VDVPGGAELMSKWIRERPEYYVQTGSMFENPHGVPWPEIVRMILDNPPEVTAQTVFGKYVESSGLVFTGELIQQAIDRSLDIVRGSTFIDRHVAEQAQLWFKARGEWGNRWHTGVDFARQTDYTVISTVDCAYRPARLVYWRRLNRVPWETIYGEVGRAVHLFGRNVLVDSSGPGGDTSLDALESRVYCPLHHRSLLADSRCMRDGKFRDCSRKDYLALSCAEGFHFTGPTKKELVEHLRNVLSVGYDSGHPESEFGWLRLPPIPQLEEELSFYAWDDKKLETDCLFSLALACWSGLEDPIGEPSIGSPHGE